MLLRRTLNVCFLVLIVNIVSASSAVGQTAQNDTTAPVVCGAPLVESSRGTCTGTMTTYGDLQRAEIVLRLTHSPLAKHRVIFKADKGTLTRDTVISDEEGVVRTAWYRTAAAGSAGIAADVMVGTGSVLQFIELKSADVKVHLTTAHAPSHGAYVGTGTRPLILEVRLDSGVRGVESAITDPALCSKFRVAFATKSTGAVVNPDTSSGNVYAARARWSAEDFKPGCFITTHWRLGSDADVQELRATPIKLPGYRVADSLSPFEVTARRLPQFVLAASAVYYKRRFMTLTTAPGIKVERTLTTGKVTYDSTATTGVDTVHHSVAGLVGAIIPIPFLARTAIVIGLDVTQPKRSQFIGVSLAELLAASLPQKFPLDILLLAQRTHLDELVNPVSDVKVCNPGVSTDPCKTMSGHVWGLAIAISIDAGSLLADVIKSIAK